MNAQDNTQVDVATYIGIRQLIDRYTFIINHRRWAELPDIFTTDALWKAVDPINLEFKGLEQIKANIPDNVEKLVFLFQSSSEILITAHSGDSVSVHSQLIEIGRFSDTGKGMKAIGSYEDMAVRQKGVWKFESRTFVLRYLDNDYPLRGEIVR